ncbi:MAG: peptidase family protein [Gemmatimonadetes bacterium]|nr:peptidase family protein [Gemmatimonadota bacterium]
MRISRVLAASVLLLAPLAAHAQKKALTQADWDKWKSIQSPALSSDGKWALYTISPQVGDGELVVRATQGTTEIRVPRGYIGRPNNVPGGLRAGRGGGNPEDEPGGAITSPGQFTADGKFALVLTYPAQSEFDKAARNRAQTAALTSRADLAIVSLADGKITTIPRVRSFRLPTNSGAWLAYVPEDSTVAGDSTAAGRGGRAGRGGGAGGDTPRRTYGNALVLRNMSTGAEERLSDVQAYVFDDSAKVMGYTVVSRQAGKDGAFLRTMSTATTTPLLTGTGDYRGLSFDRSASQVAFLTNRDDFGKPKAAWTIYYAPINTPATATVAVSAASVPAGMRVSESGVTFTRAGNALLFGIAPIMADSVPSDSLVGKAVFDLWHYKDPQLQPTQRINAVRDRNRSHQSLWYPATKKLVTLAVDSLPNVTVSDDAKVVLGTSRERYNIESMWGDGATDVYLMDGTTGVAKVVRERITGNAQLSPDSKYVALFDKGHWYTYNTSSGKTTNVTFPIKGVSFANETTDTPSNPGSWGIAGWTKSDNAMLVYDRFDLWQIDPAGVKPAVMVTDSVGRKNHLTLRLIRLGGARGGRGGGGGGRGGGAAADSSSTYEPDAPLFFHAMNEETKQAGFYRDQLGTAKAPEPVVMADVAWGTPVGAKNADQLLVTKGTFVDFPNLYTGTSLTNLTRISDVNPQQKDYNWGTVELVKWISTDGHEQKGMLYKPENFDPKKKYPMISYFYEQLSNGLHNYVPPNGRNVINPTHYVSNGYLVFEPDIHYEIGYPGPSAMKSIVPGVQMLLQRGYVDPKKLGLQGQSWGGYQTLYMITQTQMFAAAMAGAPVVNMTSAYGGIRWGTGISRSGQYEHGQSRIGGSLWESPMKYIENSPLFWLDKVTTPLFIMNNDADDAVPWYQGIETFVGMRRLGKEVYFIDYNNDVHNPASRANQKDIAMRMQQFFDNKLKGAPAPDWMVHGIPYRDKGRDQLATQALP